MSHHHRGADAFTGASQNAAAHADVVLGRADKAANAAAAAVTGGMSKMAHTVVGEQGTAQAVALVSDINQRAEQAAELAHKASTVVQGDSMAEKKHYNSDSIEFSFSFRLPTCFFSGRNARVAPARRSSRLTAACRLQLTPPGASSGQVRT